MTIILIKPAKPPNDAWNIEIASKEIDTDSVIRFDAIVTHIRTRKRSFVFTVGYNKHSNTVFISSRNYEWNCPISKNDGIPKGIVKEMLKVPILTSVMYHISCSHANQTDIMNEFFGCDIYNEENNNLGNRIR